MNTQSIVRTALLVPALLISFAGVSEKDARAEVAFAAAGTCIPNINPSSVFFTNASRDFINMPSYRTGAIQNRSEAGYMNVMCGLGIRNSYSVSTKLMVDYIDRSRSSSVACALTMTSFSGSVLYTSEKVNSSSEINSHGHLDFTIPANTAGYIGVECSLPPYDWDSNDTNGLSELQGLVFTSNLQ